MELKAIEKFLYDSGSTEQEIYSFLNFLYTNEEANEELSDDFFEAFKKAYKKENIIAILNREIEEEASVLKDNETVNKDEEIEGFIKLTKSDMFKEKIYDIIESGTSQIKSVHNNYLEKLKKKGSIKYIIIGEAPPFSFNDKFTFDNKYILSKPNAGIWQSSIRGAFGIEIEKNAPTPEEFINGLLDKNILFFDIIPVTLPFNTDIRTGWIDQNKEIDFKPLLVSLLELAVKRNVVDLTIDPNVKVAFVTPPKTSVSIFDHFSDKKLKIKDEISVDITIINDNTTKKKYINPEDLKNIILPMYKANAMMGSNAPSLELLRLALDL
jgi:hypothetical protein